MHILRARCRVRREDLTNFTCVVKGSAFGKPDLNEVHVGSQTFMVKDVQDKPLLFRWTLGVWLIHKEWRIYSRLAGIRGIPRAIERMDRFSFAMEFIQGRPIARGESLSPSFFSDLERILRDVHARGVVHLDLRHKGNILVSEAGEPYLIDFNSSFSFNQKGFLRRYLFPVLCWVDFGGLLKLKQRVSPASMTPQELSSLKRFNRIRRLWIFN
jgi:RIO-like serine/threonine protein kinase